MTMDGNKCILQLRGLRPFLSPKYDLRKHPNFMFMEGANKRSCFDSAKLISTKLAVKPDDQFSVFEVGMPDELIDADEDILNYDDLDDTDAFV